MSPRSSRLDRGWLEESGLVWQIKIPSASRQWLSADIRWLPAEAMAPGCTVGWTQAGYAVGDVFLGHFSPHYPNSTIPDSCQVTEHCCDVEMGVTVCVDALYCDLCELSEGTLSFCAHGFTLVCLHSDSYIVIHSYIVIQISSKQTAPLIRFKCVSLT